MIDYKQIFTPPLCGIVPGQLNKERRAMAEKHSDKIPQYEINALARCLLPEIQKFFASPEGQKEFEEWKAQRAKEAEQHKSV